jgi:hypothetical protein
MSRVLSDDMQVAIKAMGRVLNKRLTQRQLPPYVHNEIPAATPPDVHVHNSVETPAVINEVAPTPITIENRLQSPEVRNEFSPTFSPQVQPTPVTIENRIEPTPIRNEFSPQLNLPSLQPTPVTIENRIEPTPITNKFAPTIMASEVPVEVLVDMTPVANALKESQTAMAEVLSAMAGTLGGLVRSLDQQLSQLTSLVANLARPQQPPVVNSQSSPVTVNMPVEELAGVIVGELQPSIEAIANVAEELATLVRPREKTISFRHADGSRSTATITTETNDDDEQ